MNWRSYLRLLFGVWIALSFSGTSSSANDFSHNDACTASGAWHQNNASGHMDFLICDGANWKSALQFNSAGNNIRLDNDPAIGNAGCLRYNGTSGRLEFAHDCSNFSALGEPIWSTGAADDIHYTSGTPQVGIGTASPTYTLDVNGVIRVTDHIVVNSTAGAATPNFFDLDDLASVSLSAPSNGEVLEFDGSNWVNSSSGGGSGLWTEGTGGDIYYNSGSPQVGIGKSDPTVALDVVGDINYTGVVTDVSDIRLKYDIQPLQSPLQKITSLNGFAFKMKGDENQSVEYGVSAQDVQVVFPELVHQVDDNGTLGVSYNGLIAPMIEAMKEQQAEIDSLKAEIEALKRNIASTPEEL